MSTRSLLVPVFLFLALLAAAPVTALSEEEKGRQLIVKMGCAGCHEIADPAFTDLPRRGPDLRRVASKVDPGWATRWIMGPREFRSTTWMPHFFEVGDPRNIHSILSYLWDKSERIEYEAPPAGDVENGARLFESVGCTGCHLREADVLREDYPEPQRLQGPNLIYLGSKTTASWTYAWLKNPRVYAPQTLMPNLRLSDQEAADLTAFLMQSRNEEYEDLAFSDYYERDIDQGHEAIERYLCYGCHLIPGFEDRRPDIPAIEGPVSFGHGHGLRALRPHYELSFDEIDLIEIASESFGDAWETEREKALGEGRKLVSTKNCQGCHMLEGRGQAIRATIHDSGLLPPWLDFEGARAQEEWLSGFLADPGNVSLRPWLTARMPTFGFDEKEIGQLQAYFTALAEEVPAARPAAVTKTSVAVGRELFNSLECARCHPSGAEEAAELGLEPSNLAPSLGIADQRLRHGFISTWILEPQRFQPDTKMPSYFQREGDGYASIFAAAVDQPEFADAKARLLEHFESEEALREFLGDAEKVAAAMADWVWSLE